MSWTRCETPLRPDCPRLTFFLGPLWHLSTSSCHAMGGVSAPEMLAGGVAIGILVVWVDDVGDLD